ncbi:MAG: retron system putative HNH endonuclease, partial [Microcystis sp.]
ANSDWQPDFKNLAGKPKEILIKALMTEQGEICCYCESRLVDGKCHIEHFKPQSDPTVDPLDYANLLCSCQANLKPGEPRHCGNLKNSWFDENLLISPLNPDCESHFAFNYDGTIKPAQEDDQ